MHCSGSLCSVEELCCWIRELNALTDPSPEDTVWAAAIVQMVQTFHLIRDHGEELGELLTTAMQYWHCPSWMIRGSGSSAPEPLPPINAGHWLKYMWHNPCCFIYGI